MQTRRRFCFCYYVGCNAGSYFNSVLLPEKINRSFNENDGCNKFNNHECDNCGISVKAFILGVSPISAFQIHLSHQSEPALEINGQLWDSKTPVLQWLRLFFAAIAVSKIDEFE